MGGQIAPCEGVMTCPGMRDDTDVSCPRTAEPIEMSFGLWTRNVPWKDVLHGGAHWRNLANTIEPSVFGGYMRSFCEITLTTCYISA